MFVFAQKVELRNPFQRLVTSGAYEIFLKDSHFLNVYFYNV
jgi:hypothetical protein